LKAWGYKEGKTLFGFGYDFRQSNRYVMRTIVASAVVMQSCPNFAESCCSDSKLI
jgi:serine protease inhibitor ecotin